jgi:hypothetical protein
MPNPAFEIEPDDLNDNSIPAADYQPNKKSKKNDSEK